MAVIRPFRALRPAREQRRRRLLGPLRRRQHRGSAAARRRQSAQLPARHALGDRSARRHRSVLGARSTRRRARTSRRCAPARRSWSKTSRRSTSTACAWAATSRPASPRCFSVDEYEQDVIKKHERTRRDKEDDRTRHIIELARADRRRVPDLPRVGRHRSAVPRRHGRRAALRLPRRRRRAPHDLAGARRARPPRWWTPSRGSRRCTLPTGTIARRARRARAPSCGGRGDAGGRHLHRGRVSRRTRCTSFPTTAP